MKRILLSLLIATASLATTAQTTEPKKQFPKATFGIQGGANINTIVGKAIGTGEKLDNDFTLGFHLGVNVEIPLSPILYIQPGLQGIIKGAKKKTSTFMETTKFYYVEMPVNVIYKPQVGDGHIIAGIGASVAYGISGTWKFDNVVDNQFDDKGKITYKNSWNPNTSNPDNDKYIRPLDVSAKLILGYQLANNLYFQFNGQYSVLNIAPKIETAPAGFIQGNAKNLNLGLSVGFRF